MFAKPCTAKCPKPFDQDCSFTIICSYLFQDNSIEFQKSDFFYFHITTLCIPVTINYYNTTFIHVHDCTFTVLCNFSAST